MRKATRTPLLSAHRGGFEERYVPNSLAAVNAVRDLGVDLIEFDVRVTKDGKFVTLHDEDILVRGKQIPIEQLSAATVLQHAEGACFLEEMLFAIKGHAIAHVDIKDTYREIDIVDVCEEILGRNGFIITTLEDESVRTIRQARPHIQVALSLGRSIGHLPLHRALKVRISELFPAHRIAACQPTMLALNHKITHFGLLRWAHHKHFPVLLWTMNTPELIDKAWRNPYIWAFTTNYPRFALNSRHDRQTRPHRVSQPSPRPAPARQ